MKDKKHFWNWAGNLDSRELYICGTIAEDESWLDDSVTPEEFKSELMSGSGPVTLWLNSYGGDCVAASRIYSMLMDYPDDVTVKIDGIAASAASVIAMAGTKVLMAPTASMMIHDPMTIAVGSSAEMEKAISMLDSVKDSIMTAYQIRTGLSKDELSELMTQETWLSASKAIELGFADGMLEKEHLSVNNMATPVLFSQKAVDMALVNRIEEKAGIPVKPLYDRLYKLKTI